MLSDKRGHGTLHLQSRLHLLIPWTIGEPNWAPQLIAQTCSAEPKDLELPPRFEEDGALKPPKSALATTEKAQIR